MHQLNASPAAPDRATITRPRTAAARAVSAPFMSRPVFVAQAHSFVQQARLAITLAWVAGCTNIVAFLTCAQVASHVSGTTSNLGQALAEGNWSIAAYALFVLAAFYVGAVISGAATEFGRRAGWESIYVLPMAIEAVLLTVFAIAVELHDPMKRETGAGLYLLTSIASMAMGLQNATITRISGGVVRTTHTTGTLTDLGLESVQAWLFAWDKRRDIPPGSARAVVRSIAAHPSARRLALLVSILGSFAFGAAFGTLAFMKFPHYAMFPPVFFLLWIVVQDVRRPIAELAPSDLMNDAAGLNLPKAMAIYHIRKDKRGRPGIHRMPNLMLWAERLPRETRVLILDLEEVVTLDGNSVFELRAMLSKMESQGKRLILAGITPERYAALRGGDEQAAMDLNDVCPDIEFAIARGLNVLAEMAGGRG